MPTRHILALPDLGLARVIVGVWLVDEGARVTEGDRLVEVISAGVTVDLSAPASGMLVAQLVEEDEPLAVGQALAVVESSDD